MVAEPIPSPSRAVTVSFPNSYAAKGFGHRSCATRPIRDLYTVNRQTAKFDRLMAGQQIRGVNYSGVIYINVIHSPESEPHHSDGQLKLSAP